jgi:hypothetical protein
MPDAMWNAPCPCGSGRPFLDCCFRKMQDEKGPAAAILEEIKKRLAGQKLSSIEEARGIVGGIVDARNVSPIDDFHGLSSEQMHRFLNFPFDSSRFVQFSVDTEIPDVPFLRLFRTYIRAVADAPKGLKTTANATLPRNICREAALAYYGPEKYELRMQQWKIMAEKNFQELIVARMVADMAGFTKFERGRFKITNKGREAADKISGKIFLDLFRTYMTRLNWGYRDGYPDLAIVQVSFLFTLFLLQKYGQNFLPPSFYADIFVKAFPMAMNEVHRDALHDPEEVVKRCYEVRALDRFARFLGFADFKFSHPMDEIFFMRDCELKKTEFVDGWVKFNLYP